MKYLHYHNTNANKYAQHYFTLNYNELTSFQQDLIDNALANDYLQN
jgi:hypothetical protein